MQHLVLDERCMEMINYGHVALRQFPKKETHVLGAEIRHSMLRVHRLIITAAKRFHKKTTLTDLDIEVAVLQRLVRLAQIAQSITSWIAHAKHADTFGLRSHLLKQPFKKGNNNAVYL